MVWNRTSLTTWEITGVAVIMKRLNGNVTGYILNGDRHLELGNTTPKAARIAMEQALA